MTDLIAWFRRHPSLTAFGVFSLYVSVRLLMLPADADIVGGFQHDSAYICIIANQLKAGHGFVNPASWLLFLNPASLPMPFHNANPLYPVVIASVSAVTGMTAPVAGLAISAFSHGLLMLAIFQVVRKLKKPLWVAALCALLTGAFPPIWQDSLAVGPDALATALLWLAVALVLWRPSNPILSGLAFGLAWLTRSSAVILAPVFAWWMWRRYGTRVAALRTIGFLATAAIVTSPWLVHTARVWGSPLRSDNYAYLIQSYESKSRGIEVDQYWRSLTPPRPLSAILKTEAPVFAKFVATNVPKLAYFTLAGWTSWNKLASLLLLLIACVALVRRFDWRSVEFQTSIMIVVLFAATLLLRADDLEIRYVGFATCLFVICVVMPLAERTPPLRWRLLAILWLVYAGFVILPQDQALWRSLAHPAAERAAYREADREIARVFPNEPIISAKPYFFSFDTGGPALSPPYTSKGELLAFMERYGAHYILLPSERLNYYYPKAIEALAPEVTPVRSIGSFTLLAKQARP